jgi:translation initiation factor IF-1
MVNMAVTKKLAGEVVMMDILTGSLKLRDENGMEHKIRVAGRYLMGIDPGDKVEVEIRRGKTKSVTKIPEIQAAHPEPTTEPGPESEKSEFEKRNSQ